ncbi:MAG: hypothetical protein LBE12_12340, partial [Planctomycetaceae bacterium]|nr:hypothetical protein [Planctomycetaceae bacterium]
MTIQKYILSFFVFLITVVAAFSQETTTITDVVDKTLIDKHFPEQKLSEPQKEIDDNTERIVLRWYLKNACNNSATYLQQSVPETPFNPNRAVIFSDIVRKGKSSPFCNAKPIVCCCNCTMVYLSPCCYKPARFTGLSLRFIYRKSFISFGHTGFRNNPNNVGTLCSPQPCGQQNEKPKDQKDGQKDRKKPEDQSEGSGNLDTSPDFYITDDIITQEWIDERWFKIKLPKTKEKIDKFCEYINNNKSIDDNSIIESNIFYRLPKYEEWKEKVTNNNKDNRWPDFTK